MKGFQSCLRDVQGQELAEPAEMAHVLSNSYARLCASFIERNRKLRTNFAIIGSIGVILAIVFAVIKFTPLIFLGLVTAGAGWGVFAFILRRMPKAQVVAIAKAYWIGSFQDFEGGKLLIDKSQLTKPTDFNVPVPGTAPQELEAAAAESERLMASLPILAPLITGDTVTMADETTRRRDPFRCLQEQIATVAEGLGDMREEHVSLTVLPINAPLTQAILRDMPSSPNLNPRQPLTGVTAEAIESRLKDLGRLTSIAREKTEHTDTVDELTEHVVDRLEACVNTLTNMQRKSLIEILNPLLVRLEHAYRAPMMLYYCPECLKKAAKDINLKLENVLGVHIQDSVALKDLFQESLQMSLSEAVGQFVTTSRAAIMKLALTPKGEEVWKCSLGHPDFPLDSDKIYLAYRAKQELVLPLWDQLWMELSTERAGLYERKDKEQRDNVQAEHRETVQAAEEFNTERRDIKNRLENLNMSTVRAIEIFTELTSSFVESRLVGQGEMAVEMRQAQQFRTEYSGLLADIDKKISAIEAELGNKREDCLHRHGPVMEVVDSVKISSQFMEPPPSKKEEILIEKL